ncbi:hypothetical protein J7T55_012350 [Diaporthe amygdali]|uniref:uncharacterized protein n=1 Tax=Phomopsis amygdali TaxID=1214568 RepID=UPI0022FEEECF|nr:uncharacterized protein J7T55_012350 [Diaporthe amygdali]KAJ0123879.1 hypothetical protein J7T55_012350 [Diaporthe amygdali]
MLCRMPQRAILAARWNSVFAATSASCLRYTSQMAHLMYACDVDAEPLHRYCIGGYHPLKLGDVLKHGRYRIMHKVGWGGYSTTWAARDQQEDRYVALKVSVSEKRDNRESEILRVISALPKGHPGQDHVVQMVDHFEETGPNGTHECLVLELLGPNVPDLIDWIYTDERLPARLAKSIAHQALLGVGFLSTYEIGHGDLHSRNLAFKIPNFDSLNQQEFYDKLGEPETALLFELVTGQPPFDAIMATPESLIQQMMDYCTDSIPDRWQKKWQEMEKDTSRDYQPPTLQQWLEEVYFDPDRNAEFTKQYITKVGLDKLSAMRNRQRQPESISAFPYDIKTLLKSLKDESNFIQARYDLKGKSRWDKPDSHLIWPKIAKQGNSTKRGNTWVVEYSEIGGHCVSIMGIHYMYVYVTGATTFTSAGAISHISYSYRAQLNRLGEILPGTDEKLMNVEEKS